MMKKDKYREAADKIWDLATEYRLSGNSELAILLKQLVTELHAISREKELLENNNGQEILTLLNEEPSDD